MNWVDEIKSEIELFIASYNSVMAELPSFNECLNTVCLYASTENGKRVELIHRAINYYEAGAERKHISKLEQISNDIDAYNVFNYASESDKEVLVRFLDMLENISINALGHKTFDNYRKLLQVLSIVPDHPSVLSCINNPNNVDERHELTKFDIETKYSILCRQTFGLLVYRNTDRIDEKVYSSFLIPGLWGNGVSYKLFREVPSNLKIPEYGKKYERFLFINKSFLQELYQDLVNSTFQSPPELSIHICNKLGKPIPKQLLEYKDLFEEPFEMIQIRDQRSIMERSAQEQIDAINANAELDRELQEEQARQSQREQERRAELDREAHERASDDLLKAQREANRLFERNAAIESARAREQQENQQREQREARNHAMASCYNCKKFKACRTHGTPGCGAFEPK